MSATIIEAAVGEANTAGLQPETVNKLRFAVDAACAMLAGMQLDVFTPLKSGPMTVEEISSAIGVAPRRLRLLLYSLVSAGLLTEREGRFSNTVESNSVLVKGSSSYMGHMHALLSNRWLVMLKTAESIRTGIPQAMVDFSNSPKEEIEAFLRRINSRTVAAAHGLMERYEFSTTKTIADVGCGGAGLALTIAKAFPHLKVTAIDVPQVASIAQKIVEEEGAERVQVIAADVLSGPLPGCYDVVVVAKVLQVLSPEDARLAAKNIAAALNPGGKIFIIGQILDDSRLSPLEAVGFNLSFINIFESGESYTEGEYRESLSEAGFVNIERPDFFLAEGLGVMTARKEE